MKNQYFGDINDYKKYGLLRAVIRATDFRILVAWMLTPDDQSTDGKFVRYLQSRNKLSHHDPVLFDALRTFLFSQGQRTVRLIEDSDLLPGATYFTKLTPDSGPIRGQWFSSLLDRAKSTDLVFLDPDNGLEVKSKPYGRGLSSKYLYWREVESLWSYGKSLLIYQHFIRENRVKFIQRMLEALHEATPGSYVEAFSTSNVVFLMALRPQHRHFHEVIVESVQRDWEGRIQHWDLVRTQ